MCQVQCPYRCLSKKQGTLTQKIRALKPQKTGKTGEILVQKTGIQDRILNLNIQKSWNSQLPNVGFGAKEYQTTYRPHGCLKLYRVWGKSVSNN